MARNQNRSGGAWTEAEKLAVWRKAIPVNGIDTTDYRKDICGHWIKYAAHGDTTSQYGWEIDHINPVANGGTDSIENLQPLYWENNRDKGDKLNRVCGMK